MLTVQVVGCGDAFGSGGRFNTCFHVAGRDTSLLVDCGASSMVALRRFGIDPNGIGSVVLTHLHGDHFGGLPFLILDAQLVSRRVAPLTIAGPAGTAARLAALMEAMFPGSSTVERRFTTTVVEYEPGGTTTIGEVRVTPFEVRHPSGAPAFALRIALDGKVVCYTGDTEWVDALVPAGRDADLFIAEGYTAERPVRFHLDWATLRVRLPEIRPKRLLLTHMSPDMLARPPDGYEAAEDGLVLTIG